MFKAVDVDGNGVLDKTEFIRLAKSDQLRLTRRKVFQHRPNSPQSIKRLFCASLDPSAGETDIRSVLCAWQQMTIIDAADFDVNG